MNCLGKDDHGQYYEITLLEDDEKNQKIGSVYQTAFSSPYVLLFPTRLGSSDRLPIARPAIFGICHEPVDSLEF